MNTVDQGALWIKVKEAIVNEPTTDFSDEFSRTVTVSGFRDSCRQF